MSRGHGRVQREILVGLEGLSEGSVLLVGDGGPSYRRAAHKLAAEGRVVLVPFIHEGRRRLGVRRMTVLERVRRQYAARSGGV